METKPRKCKQCGEIKPLDSFRQYYGESKLGKPRGRYKLCKDCESINTRAKYLNKKAQRSEAEEAELQDINELYDLLRSQGLEPPARRQEAPATRSLVQEMKAKHAEKLQAIRSVGDDIPLDTPVELLEWLTKDLAEYDGDDLWEISDRLEETYTPKVGVDPETMKPIRDDKYRDIIEKIDKRFREAGM